MKLQSNEFDSGIEKANKSTSALDHSFASLKSTIGGVVAGLASFEFLKSSVESFNSAAQASAQLDASLRSTANAAGLNRKALDEQSAALMRASLFDDDEITASQALLATFTQIHDTVFMKAIPAITDLATKMGGDLQGATVQVGKALNDPIKGINALQRVGVSFTESQKQTIKTLVETNKVAEAQSLILKELTNEFGGSALAASQAGTGGFTVLGHEFGNVKEAVGALVVSFVEKLKPQLEWLVGALQRGVDWLSKHTDQIKETGKALAVAYGGFMLLKTGIALATAETISLNAAFAVSPIGLVTTAVIGLATAYGYLASSAERANNAMAVSANAAQENQIKAADELKKGYEQLGMKSEAASKSVYEFFQKENDQKIQRYEELIRLTPPGETEKISDYEQMILDSYNRKRAISQWYDASGKSPITTKSGLGSVAANNNSPSIKRISSPAGQKATTINVSIKEFGKVTVNATTIKEGAQKIHDEILKALTGAINDFQIIAR